VSAEQQRPAADTPPERGANLASPPAARRRPRWAQEGEDPDYRFSLANERTFLAWIRTALALLAGSVALRQLVPTFGVPGVRTSISLLLAGLGLAIAATAYRHWAACESAMRRKQTLPPSPLMPWLAWVLGVVAVILVAAVLIESV
jgi:putative membrane protein